jgi:hypothetical protein
MNLLHPDVLASAKGISPGAAGFACLVGLLLWALGWRWHRFWIVFGITTAAGVIGLNAGKAAGGHVLVIGLLLAFAGGVMALELAKILSFVAGGIGAWLAVQSVLPQAQEMWAVFLAGGLMGVLLHRLWTMLLTSSFGILLAGHAGLMLAEGLAKLDAPTWAAKNAAVANAAVVALAVIGVLVQSVTVEKPVPEPVPVEPEPKKKKKAAVEDDEPVPSVAGAAPWWRRLKLA